MQDRTEIAHEPATASLPQSGGAIRAHTLLGGRWQLVAPLGSGGMGEVWRARHIRLGRDVAVKLLTAPTAANRSRMLREAQVLASLRHEAIVEVFDVGEHDGTPYFVMDWVDGDTLAQRVERHGPAPAREAARAFIPLLHGLAAAHRAGVIHRDMKPDNVLAIRRGDGILHLVLIDFGIAHRHGLESKLTATGALVGTPEYMAPEVLRGAEADARADVWGAAATLYETLSGVSPFRRADFVATVRAVAEDTPVTVPDAVPATLGDILQRGLAKDPRARFSSATDMAAALESWLSGASPPEGRGLARTLPPIGDSVPRLPHGERFDESSTTVSRVGARVPHPPPAAFLPSDDPAEPAPGSFDALIRSKLGGR